MASSQDLESLIHDQVTQCFRDIHEVAEGLEPKMQYCPGEFGESRQDLQVSAFR